MECQTERSPLLSKRMIIRSRKCVVPSFLTGGTLCCIVGACVGGPVGFLLGKLIHAGVVAAFLLDVGTTTLGITAGGYLHRRLAKTDTTLIRLYGEPSDECVQEIQQILQTGSDVQALTWLGVVFQTDPWFRRTYSDIIKSFYTTELDPPMERLETIREILDTVTELMVQRIPLETTDEKVLLISCCESIVMMTFYEEAWRICLEIMKEKDRAFSKARFHTDMYNTPSTLCQLHRIEEAHTASGKVAALVRLSILFTEQEVSRDSTFIMNTDRYLELLIALLCDDSTRRHRTPFAEHLFMSSLFEVGGREAYLLSNWEASCVYLSDGMVNRELVDLEWASPAPPASPPCLLVSDRPHAYRTD